MQASEGPKRAGIVASHTGQAITDRRWGFVYERGKSRLDASLHVFLMALCFLATLAIFAFLQGWRFPTREHVR